MRVNLNLYFHLVLILVFLKTSRILITKKVEIATSNFNNSRFNIFIFVITIIFNFRLSSLLDGLIVYQSLSSVY